MVKYVDYDILFQEIPDEVTLGINLSGCPYRCRGCHSPHLQENIGEELNETALSRLLQTYGESVNCICFMGGDADPETICRLACYVRENGGGSIKTAWFSGNENLYERAVTCFNYVKTGSYIESLGAINKKGTNQRLNRIDQGQIYDITSWMRASGPLQVTTPYSPMKLRSTKKLTAISVSGVDL